ncbi:hypothetical protein [Dyella acidiphila]|uniref:DUF4124 domain-containing protein n=1 Tax=Dyella acidiphila TaxID=2775866 RepID=A0ABR9GBW1_9GAMM|nr:hypothetical protein [Dyella acidiphila]MBE1161538.1 hypothetical protein [Dyella acidiphila]
MNARRHEQDGTDTLALFRLGAVFVVLLVLILAAMYALWQRVLPRYPPIPAKDIPSSPRLQAVPPVDRITLYRVQHTQLESYGWIDPSKGTAHIPIERAMTLLAAQKTSPAASAPNDGAHP